MVDCRTYTYPASIALVVALTACNLSSDRDPQVEYAFRSYGNDIGTIEWLLYSDMSMSFRFTAAGPDKETVTHGGIWRLDGDKFVLTFHGNMYGNFSALFGSSSDVENVGNQTVSFSRGRSRILVNGIYLFPANRAPH